MNWDCSHNLLWEGTALAVPLRVVKDVGFSPEAH
jgi:hypothetical protein